jgi:hypothetical protein
VISDGMEELFVVHTVGTETCGHGGAMEDLSRKIHEFSVHLPTENLVILVPQGIVQVARRDPTDHVHGVLLPGMSPPSHETRYPIHVLDAVRAGSGPGREQPPGSGFQDRM